MDPATLERAQRSLAGQGFQNLDILGFNYKNMRPNFVLGPPCLKDCGPADLDTPLFLVNPDLNRIDFAALPLDKAIKEVRGNGKRQVAVFSDPDCPYCKRLEVEFAQMTDITIYNFMMPIPSLHPRAQNKAEQIWCQPDRTAAWTAWMREGKNPPPVAACANPVAETMALGQQHGFNGTPTMVMPNGKVISGYLRQPELTQALDENQTAGK